MSLAVREQFIELHRRKLADLHNRAAGAIRQLSDADINWRPNEDSNSIANLIIHMAGNLHQRLEAGIAGQPDTRDRDREFNERGEMTRDEALALLDRTVKMADGVLANLKPEDLDRPQWIRGRETTVLEVLFATMTHMPEHVGQILYIAKLRLGAAYRVVSIGHKKRA